MQHQNCTLFFFLLVDQRFHIVTSLFVVFSVEPHQNSLILYVEGLHHLGVVFLALKVHHSFHVIIFNIELIVLF